MYNNLYFLLKLMYNNLKNLTKAKNFYFELAKKALLELDKYDLQWNIEKIAYPTKHTTNLNLC